MNHQGNQALLNQSRTDGWTTAHAEQQRQTDLMPAAETPTAEVRTGCIGRGHAGKTALFRALIEGPIGDYFPSGLHVDVGNPREAAKMIRDAEETRRILELGGLPPTLEASQIHYYLYDGDEERVIYQMREVIGQILTHTLPDSDQEQQALYEDYLRSLLDTHVLWTVIPVPPPNPSAQDKRRYANDLRITGAYLREALRRRTSEQPCAVALIITKIDTLFDSEESAREALTDDLLIEALGPLINTVRRSARVEDAAIFPLTAFGFGNGVLRKLDPDENNRQQSNPDDNVFGSEAVWLLRDSATMEPYNLSTLVLWTLLFGLLDQQARDRVDELAEVCQMLRDDLDAEDRWLVPIKGRLEENRSR